MIACGVWEGQKYEGRGADGLTAESPTLTQLAQLRAYEPGNRALAVMGWDGFFSFDDSVDVIDMARAYVEIVQNESCGKCVPCRMGTRVAAEILTRIADGKAQEKDLRLLRQVGRLVRAGSMCELGHTSPDRGRDRWIRPPSHIQRRKS